MSAGKKQPWKEWIILAALVVIAVLIGLLFPEKRMPMAQASWSLGKEMLMILPAVLVLMGLFSVWISREMVVKYLGQTAGVRGVVLALLLGATPTGPLYVAFPLATALRKKGARLSNIVIFLIAWACIKLPQEMIEWQFLGAHFMLARLILTTALALIIGLTMEKIIDQKNHAAKKSKRNG